MKRNMIAVAIALILFGCQNEKKEHVSTGSLESMDSVATDTTAPAKMVKTADMRFRVQNVQHTKVELGEVINALGGTITEFSIQNDVQQIRKVKLSTDSLKEITSYRTDGFIVARVPSEKLNDLTNRITKMAVFVNSSSMKMDDQLINYLANQLKAQNRDKASSKMDKISTKKVDHVNDLLVINDDLVDKKLENMQINDRVKFSTLTLNLYQDNTIQSMVVANDDLSDYQPGFGKRFWLSIENGWWMFKELILAMANLWMLILIGSSVFVIVKFYKKRKSFA